jgi:hypothetical protein
MPFISTLKVRVGRQKPNLLQNRTWLGLSDPMPQVDLASIALIYFKRIGNQSPIT